MHTKSKRKEAEASGITREEGKLLIKIANKLTGKKRRGHGKAMSKAIGINFRSGQEKIKKGMSANYKIKEADKNVSKLLEGQGLIKIQEAGGVLLLNLTKAGELFYIKNKNKEFFQ